MRVSSLRKTFTVAIAIVLGVSISGCSDSTTEPVDPGTSPIHVFHAHYDFTQSINFNVSTTTIASGVSFGQTQKVQARNGSTTVTAQGTGGTALASSTVQIDSTRSIWVILAGEGLGADAIGISSLMPTPADTANANIRVLHASKNTQDVDVRITATNGLAVASSVKYKEAKPDGFVVIPKTTTNVFIMKKGSTSPSDVLLNVPVSLEGGKTYTLLLYGSSSTTANPSMALATKLVAE